MTAPLIAAVLANRETAPAPNYIAQAIDAFGDRQQAVNARWDVVDAMPGTDGQLALAQEGYLARIADTALLACTASAAAEMRGGGSVDRSELVEFAVGPGLAARGIAAVLAHERTRRLRAADINYGKATNTRDAESRSARIQGPIATIAKKLGLAEFYEAGDVTQLTLREVRGRVAEAILEHSRTGEPMGIGDLAHRVMGPIVGEQIAEERAVLAQTIAARQQRSRLVRLWGRDSGR
jgi:hypothetical protein